MVETNHRIFYAVIFAFDVMNKTDANNSLETLGFSDNERYLNYNQVLKNEFSERVQKISINAGFTCPNRDGSKGTGGCTYCNNQSFSPDYCQPTKSISQQVEEGIGFFHGKYESQLYLAYFQSYTNTYAGVDELKRMYEEALAHPKVVGLVIGTRPDCVNEELLSYFEQLSKQYYVMIEYGIESTDDKTLEFINRGHDYACAKDAIIATASKGIRTGAHLILGLPGETRKSIISHAEKISQLPLTTLKLHQLQLIKGTVMAKQFIQHPEWFHLYTADEYLDLLIGFLEHLSPAIAIERFVSQSPASMLLLQGWGLKNFEFVTKVNNQLKARTTWQGRLFSNYE